jgi:hypothetical protein
MTMSDLRRQPDEPPRPSLPMRILGWTFLFWSVGLVSCQALFVL